MDPRTVSDTTVGRIRSELSKLTDLPEPLLAALRRDRRTTVRAMAESPPIQKVREKRDMLLHERGLRARGVTRIAGVDEAGRGPLAGPVVAAAAILPEDCDLPEVCDSKKLKAETRERLDKDIREQAVAIGTAVVDVELVDKINVLQAAMKAMRVAIADLSVVPEHVLVDGDRTPGAPFDETAIVGGDDKSLSVAAASIVAKVMRDGIMVEMDERYPGYGFAQHKGYGTKRHLEALDRLGPCPIHRRSFSAVAEAGGETSPVYMHMARAIRAAESEDDLMAVGEAARDNIAGVSDRERDILRRLFRQRRAAFSRGTPR